MLTLKSTVSIAKEKLAEGLRVMKEAEGQLDIQVEVQHRHREAVEAARVEAERKTKEVAM